MSKKTKAYITKYALTQGIFEADGEESSAGGFRFRFPGSYTSEYVYGKDWHKTFPEALSRAEEMRKRKLASLNRQIKKLESIEFKLMTVWLLLWGCELTLAMLSYSYPSP